MLLFVSLFTRSSVSNPNATTISERFLDSGIVCMGMYRHYPDFVWFPQYMGILGLSSVLRSELQARAIAKS